MADLVHGGGRHPLTPGQSLFEAAAELAVAVPASCRQDGRCRECVVSLLAGADALTPPTAAEAHLPHGFRLACQARVARDDVDVEFAILQRQLRILAPDQAEADPGPLDPLAVRRGDAVLYDGDPFDAYRGALLGLALDLGTTSIVAQLVDLESGATRRALAFENPQRFGGSDVISRIAYEALHPGELRRALRRTLNRALASAYRELGLDRRCVVEVVVVGNPTMRDLFFGLDVAPIGRLPFRSTTEAAGGGAEHSGIRRLAHEVGLLVHPRARVVGVPLVGGHVGADVAADLVATGVGRGRAVEMLLDIGTNTEIVVSDGKRIVAASSPAGPAFEGGGISRGMVAGSGAVEGVAWTGTGFTWRTVGGGEPTGICGSGLVDLLAAGRAAGLLDSRGVLADSAALLALAPGGRIGLTRADVSALMQAKAATAAGQRILLRRLGLHIAAVERVVLAGGFADSLNAANAVSIGLLIGDDPRRIVRAGNAAATGARRLLLSRSSRIELDSLVGRIEHVELEAEPDFFEVYVDSLGLDRISASPSTRQA